MILFFGSTSHSLLNFKGSLINSLPGDIKFVTAGRGPLPIINPNHIAHLDLPIPRQTGEFVNLFRSLHALHSIFKKYTITSVYAYTFKPIVILSILTLFGRFSDLHIVLSIEGIGSFLSSRFERQINPPFLLRQLLCGIFRRARFIHFLNNNNLEYFSKSFPSLSYKFKLVPGTGITTSYWRPSSRVDIDNEKMLFLARHNIPFRKSSLPLVVSTLARLQEDKGVLEYLDALKYYKTHLDPNINVVFVWAGPANWGEHLVAPSQLDNSFLNYIGSLDDPRSLLQISDYYILPSRHEGLSRSILEAMAFELPVLTTDAPGCVDLIEHNVNGIVVPKNNYQQLSVGIQKLLTCFSYPCKQNRQKVLDRFSDEQVIPLVIDDLIAYH